uniref:uncharacterized protein LOC100178019 isoform X1 n=1 Tax=Ciona intestinalis TaxID=7719 RepID=UPI000EF50F57|nr:uncharacterized protein LOC100178019 isoform X1 [Ciona intestinalis]|eukprot:XP_026691339.1 uncharacterized protein LOC100178019 isoform X1 [Ciona intestinalis]
MPRYLALNYLDDSLCRKQANRARMIVPVMFHDPMDTIAVENSAYRHPWSKGCPSLNVGDLILKVGQSISSIMPSATNENRYLNFNGIQYYFNSNLVEEVIPNSDPTSQDVVDKLCFTKASNIGKAGTPVQNLSHVDLFSYPQMIASDEYSIGELACATTFTHCLPLLSNMISKLKKEMVPDPSIAMFKMKNQMKELDKLPTFVQEKSDVNHFMQYYGQSYNYDAQQFELENQLLLSINNGTKRINCSTMLQDFFVMQPFDECSMNNLEILVTKCTEDVRLNLKQIQTKLDEYLFETYDKENDSFLSLLCHDSKFEVLHKDSWYMDSIMIGLQNQYDCFTTAHHTLRLEAEDTDIAEFGNKVSECNVMEVEKYPIMWKDSSVLKLMIQEPNIVSRNCKLKMEYVPDCQQCFKCIPIHDASDIALPWDPVSHVADKTFQLRKVLQFQAITPCDLSHTFCGLKFSSELFLSRQLNLINSETLQDDAANSGLESIDGGTGESNANYSVNVDNYVGGLNINKELIEDRNVETPPTYNNVSTKSNEIAADTNFVARYLQLRGEQASDQELRAGAQIAAVKTMNTIDSAQIKKLRTAVKDKVARITNEKPDSGAAAVQVRSKEYPSAWGGSFIVGNPVLSERKKSKVIESCITGKTLEIVCHLEKSVQPFLCRLIEHNLLKNGSRLSNIKRADSRYLLNQQTKQYMDLQQIREAVVDPKYICMCNILHGMVNTYYLLIHVSHVTAFAYLHNMLYQLEHEAPFTKWSLVYEYQAFVQSLLQSMKHILSHSAAKESCTHPKLNTVKATILNWMEKKKKKNRIHQQKILIISATNCRYLFSKLTRCLKELSTKEIPFNVVAVNVDAHDLTHQDVLSIFERYVYCLMFILVIVLHIW